MNRADWATPEEVAALLLGWFVASIVLAAGWSRLHRQKRRHQQVLRDIAALDHARRQEARRGR